MERKIKIIKDMLMNIINDSFHKNKYTNSNKKKINSKVEEIIFLLRKIKNLVNNPEDKIQITNSILKISRELENIKSKFSNNENISDFSKDITKKIDDLKKMLTPNNNKDEEE